jgi:YihY family inner membrane protein
LPSPFHRRDNGDVEATRLLGRAILKFYRDEGFFLASAIAFQVLLCLVPLVLLLLSFAGTYLLSDDRAIEHFGRLLAKAVPALDPAVQKNLLAIVSYRGASGIAGTVGLLWIATTVFASLRFALNPIFGVAAHHGTLRGMLVDIGMVALSGAAFMVSIGLTTVIEYLRRTQSALFPAMPGRLLQLALSVGVPFLVMLLLCFLIFYFLPNRRVAVRAALWGALFTGLLWEAAKHLFTWYVFALGSYSIVYGSLSAAAILLAWTYYSAAVLLLGAEVAALLEQHPPVFSGPLSARPRGSTRPPA